MLELSGQERLGFLINTVSVASAWKQLMAMQSDDWPEFAKHNPSRVSGHRYGWLQRPPIHRVVVVQLLVCILLGLMLLPFGYNVCLSSILGGLCCALPNAYFIWRAFRFHGARQAKQIVSSFYRGAAGKLLLTAASFTMVFTLAEPVAPLALFGSFIAVQAVSWFTPLLVRKSLVRKSVTGEPVST